MDEHRTTIQRQITMGYADPTTALGSQRRNSKSMCSWASFTRAEGLGTKLEQGDSTQVGWTKSSK
uniref:Uncharacterized protein n=1 Tax=Arundo donax TaxID=35708 RepID=A0A0A9EAU6_ARUDO